MIAHRRMVSLHISTILREFRRCLPYATPCYAVTANSSPYLLSYLQQENVKLMKCIRVVAPPPLVTVPPRTLARTGYDPYDELIVRSVNEIESSPPPSQSPSIWIKSMISNEGVERSRELFEYIWTHKRILNGIVFDIHNFTTGYIPPTMYNYKIATEYVFRNIISPFEREYGIRTPAIMIDGRDHITQLRHLSELHNYAIKETSLIRGFSQKKPELRLMLGSLFDSGAGTGEGMINGRLAVHEYP